MRLKCRLRAFTVRVLWLASLAVYAPVAGAQPLHSQGPGLGTWSIGEVQISLSASGGDGSYVWEVVSGSTLPPGLALRTDLPSFFPASASAGLIGVATTPDDFTFTLRVTSQGLSTDRTYTLRIAPLLLQDTRLPDAFVGVPDYSYAMTAVNNAGAVSWTANSGVPPGMTLSSTGVLSGTPTTAGFYNVGFSMFDGVDTVFRGISISVFDVRILTPGELPNATQGQPYFATVAASGGSGGHTFSACRSTSGSTGCVPDPSALPGGLTLDPISGVISGTVTAGPGRYGFAVTATDTSHVSYSRAMAIRVLGVPPTLPSILPYSNFWDDCTLGVTCSRAAQVFAGGSAPLTWTATGLPPGMAIRSDSTSTATFITPGDVELYGPPTATGTYNVELTVTDSDGLSATNTFTLRVSSLLMRPSLPDGTIFVPYSSTLRVLGGTQPYAVTQVAGRLPAGLTVNPATRLVSGTPLENGLSSNGAFNPVWDFTDAGSETLRVTSFMSIGAGPSTIFITTGADLGTITAGSSFSNQLQACCVPSYAWSLESGTLPTGITLSSGGLLSGTPSSSSLGTFSFAVRATDATNSANFGIRYFTLVVTPLSITSSTTLPFGNVGTFYSHTPQVSGGTLPLTWALDPFNYLPPGLTLSSGGVLSGTPTESGQFQFSLTVTDAGGRILRRTFNVSIYPAGVNPPLNLPIGPNLGTLNIGVRSVQLSATGGTPPYHYSLTPTAPLVPGMRVQDGPPLPTSFPASVTGGYIGVLADAGTFETSIRVTDSLGDTFDRAVTFVVAPFNVVSQSSPPKARVGTFYTFALTGFGGSGNYSWSATSLPPGLSIDSFSGQISGTPTASGTFFPSIRLTDLSSNLSLPFGITLVVNPFTINSGILTPGTVNASFNQTLSQTGCGSPCTWSVVSGGLPSGISLNSTTGVLSGTPTGTFNSFFTVQASGSAGILQKVLALRIVSNTLQPLAITTTSIGDTNVGAVTAVALFVQGGTPPYTLTLDSGTLPTGITLGGPGEALGLNLGPGFSYLAGRAMEAGLYNFTLEVTDGAGTTVTRALTWRIPRLNSQYGSLPLAGTTLVFGTPYAQPLLVLGGTGVYTWADNGTMPTGLTLDPNTGVVSGPPGVTGSLSSLVLVTDDAGNTGAFNVNFNIAGPTSTLVSFGTGPNLGVAVRGFQRVQNLSPSGGTPPYTITALTPLPPGFAIQSGDSVLANGTPGTSYFLAGTPLVTGTFTFTLRAEDSVGNVGVRTFTLAVAPFTLFTSTTLPDGSLGVLYSQQLVSWEGGGPVSWSVSPTSGLPPGLSLSSGGLITGTPLQAGTISFVLNATDSSGLVISFTITLRVSSIAITDPSILPPAIMLTPFSYTFTATGGGPAKTWSAVGMPDGFTMSPTGTLSGTAGFTATFQLAVTVTDGVVPLTRRFTLFTRAPNPAQLSFAPVATALADTTVGQSTVFTLTPTGGTAPYTWSHASGLLPPGMSLISGSLFPQNFTPGSTLLAGAPTAAGLYSFDLIATDSVGAQVRRTFTLNVSAINILPNQPRSVTTGTAYAQRFTPVGGTPLYTFSMSPTSLVQDMLPPGLTLSPDGIISGTTTSTGLYSFRLRLQDDAGNTFTRQYTFVVNNAAVLRINNTNSNDWWVGGGRRIQTLATNGSSTYTWSLVGGTLPPGAMLVQGEDPNTTLLAGQPTAPGTYTYTLRATDNGNPANFADHAFTLRVSPMQVVSLTQEFMNAPELPPARVGSFYSFVFKVAGGTPTYSFVESPFAPLPAGLTLGSDGVLSGTPEVVGSFTVSPVISDSAGNTFNGPNCVLIVTPAGAPSPLVPGVATAIPDASRGVPYNLPLSPGNSFSLVRGGVPPYTWSVASGFSLPPGVAILPGADGVPDHLGGIPSVAGNYNFSLTVTDAAAQTLTIPLQAKVSALALTPDAALPGNVGVPYSVSLTASGGTPPYAIQLSPTLDMPPGLTLSSAGLLSGTPSEPGLFLVQVFVTDNAGSSLTKFYRIPIDNAAGQAPGLSLAPKPIQAYYVQTSPVPAPVTVSVNTTSGAVPFNLAVSGIPGATLSASNGTTPATVNLDLNLGSLAAGTYVGVLGAIAPDSANQFDSVPITVTVVPAPPCTYSLSPAETSAPAAGATGSFDIVTGSLCSWTASTADLWITLTSATSGTGPATVSYSIDSNPDTSPRSGSISVGGQSFDITQFGSSCSFAISPQNLTVPAGGGTAFISITASGSCPWSASGLGATPASGTGNGGVTVTIPPNGSPSSQLLTATIAEHTLNVLQTGIDCTVDITPHEAAWPSAGGTGSVTVSTPAGCAYDTVLGPSWIVVTSGASGIGSGTLVYDVQPNSTTLPRSGDLTIGGQAFQVTQEGLPCSVTVDTSGLGSPYGPSGGAGTIGITTNGPNCTWTASSGAAWASLAPPSGTGNGAIGVSLTSNASSTTARATDLTIAGQTVTISQAGTTCTYALQSSTGAVPASGGAGSVGVVAASVCGWTSASNDPGWLTITSSGTGGVGEVLFVAQANPDASPRSGTLTIAGLTYTVNQAAAPCSYTLDASGTTIASAGVSSASFGFTTTATGCSPAAVSYASWISITGTTFGGSSGTVTFSVGANPSTTTRSGTIQLGDRTFTVNQTGGQCGFSLNAYGAVFGKVGGSSSVLGSPSALGCTPDYGTDMPSFISLGTLSGPVLNIFTLPFVVQSFDAQLTPVIRRGRITFGGQIFLVKQTSW